MLCSYLRLCYILLALMLWVANVIFCYLGLCCILLALMLWVANVMLLFGTVLYIISHVVVDG